MFGKEEDINRREFLKTTGRAVAGVTLAGGVLGGVAEKVAQGAYSDDRYDFVMPRVRFDCDRRVAAPWNIYPGGDRNLLIEFSSVVRCKIKEPTGCNGSKPERGQPHQFNVVVDLSDLDELRRYPFLFMTAEGHYDLSKSKKNNLKQFLEEGGFLLMDDCAFNDKGDFFYQSSNKLMEKMFGKGCVKRIPHSHEIFHNVFDLGDVGLPYIQGQNYGAHGVFVGDRLAVLNSATDLHCGWACWKKNSRGYEQSIQMGINSIMYALSH